MSEKKKITPKTPRQAHNTWLQFVAQHNAAVRNAARVQKPEAK
jgi:hypothetical protein